ncbi:MAG: segregation/condensation protein A [Clostridia bacterium]|nr:segregation/condensation protein A [Clostridia bacterium]
MEQINYKLEVFEGPMDLLLSLISKHKLDIYDIPIMELVEQYTDYVRKMQEADMEVASEFLEMAARLVYIKTVSLLPKSEEAEELKRELTGELLEYRDCQIMAGKLKDTANGFELYTKEPDEEEADMTYENFHEPFELLSAYQAAIGKQGRKLPPPVEAFAGIVQRKIVSVQSRISFILTSISGKGRRTFSSLIRASKSRSEMVATFLALLELIRDKKVVAAEDGDDMTIEIKRS